MPHQPIEETELYARFVDSADRIYFTCRKWSIRDQNGIGDQLTSAIDSVGANLVEGDARYNGAGHAPILRDRESLSTRDSLLAPTCPRARVDNSRGLQRS